jgi:enoyl-CoA hydratase/carnithine racemase
MPAPYPRLADLDGFRVEIDEATERADITLDRSPFNIVSMPEPDQLRLVVETLDQDARARVIVVCAIGEHFFSGGNIKGFMEASPEHVWVPRKIFSTIPRIQSPSPSSSKATATAAFGSSTKSESRASTVSNGQNA